MTFQPCFYWKYNKFDWNRKPLAYPAAPKTFNGWAGGVFTAYSISNHFSLGAELTYSRQRQRHYTSMFSVTELDSTVTYYYARSAVTRLDYIKLPLLASYNLEIGYGSGLFLKVEGGPQVAFNTYYDGNNSHYGDKPNSNEIDYNTIIFENTITPFHSHHEYDYGNGIVDEDTKYLYRRFELGVAGGISLKKSIFRSYAISVGARFEQRLTDIENPDEDKIYVTFVGLTGSDINRPPTRNRRVALVLSFSRTFE